VFGIGTAIAIWYSEILLAVENFIREPTGVDQISPLILAIFIIIGWLFAVFYIFRSIHWKSNAKKYEENVKRYEVNCRNFWELSDHYSNCDKALFETFHKYMVADPIPEEPAREAIRIVNQNIDKVLNVACTIFTELTGHQCAACIKLANLASLGPEADLGDLKIRTLRRDSSSRITREMHDNARQDYVRDNTADTYIFTRNEIGEFRNDIWVCDDLESLFKDGKYINARTSWREDYNATMICGVRNLSNENSVAWQALFCVDSLQGEFDNDTAHYYAREFASRLSVLIYREQVLRGSLLTL